VQNEANILIEKLDEFIRRYYKNQLLKGAIYTTGILLSAFLTVTLLEYFGEFNSIVRGTLFFGFLFAAAGVLYKYIALPLLKLNRIGQRLSHEQAAAIIGNHFGNVQDKLLNVLQLQNHQILGGSEDLLLASIQQKTKELSIVPFSTAINLQDNRKYLPYVLPVFLLTGLMMIIWPHIFTKSATRLVHYQTYYEKEMPFSFLIQNQKLQALQTEDFRLDLKLKGDEIPAEVFVVVNGIEYKLEKENNFQFFHTFSNLQKNLKFQLAAAGFLSKEYEIEVLPKPTLLEFSMQLQYPAYLHKTDETIANTGDLVVPQGTKIKWLFHTRNTDQLSLRFSDSLVQPDRKSDNSFSYSRKFMRDELYAIRPSNNLVAVADSVAYSIKVIPDQFPQIEVSEKPDSLDRRTIYFSGSVRDDYGFSQLQFYNTRTAADTTGKMQTTSSSMPITVARDKVAQDFYYFFDASQFNLGPGDKIDYFFEIKDNDAVNGAKATRSRMMSFKAPSKDEIAESRDKNNESIKKDLEESIKKAKQLQKDVSDLSKKINDKKQLAYDDKKKLEDLLKKQQELQNKIEQVKQENQLNNQQQNEFSQMDESILEKQQELEKLFENVMTPEMKKLFDELNKMMEKLDKNQIQEKLDEMKLTNKDIEKELDRNLEAFRQLEVEQKMQEAIDKLDELKKKQDELAKESLGKKDEPKEDKKNDSGDKKEGQKSDDQKKDAADKKADDDKKGDDKKQDAADLAKQQEALNKEFEQLKKDLSEIKEKNQALEEPNKMPSTEKQSEEISQDMQNSSSQLQKNNKKSAAKSQQSASEKMEQMKEDMEKAMADEEEQQEEENAQALRQILENLLNLSFAQEELIKELPQTRVDNPQFVSIPKKQSKLKDDSKIIEDSLLALSKRVPKISALVNREIGAIHMNMEKTVKTMADRNVGESMMRMQTTMTSVNNLALLLNESLEEMQQQMKQKKESKGQKAGKCKKPGSGMGKKPSKQGNSSADMRKLQEQLNKQLQDLKDALEKGQKPGDKPGDKKGDKPGGTPKGSSGMGMPGSSEQFAKLAAQQEALRRQMQSMMEKLKNKGKNPGGDLANLMEETEKELVNKQLTNSTLKRQQEILTRLLESEKAEKEREQDEKRKSNEAKTENFGNPERFLEYKRLKEKEMELLNTVPPGLSPYYKEKVNQYFNSLNK
jgi:hypothetical protein